MSTKEPKNQVKSVDSIVTPPVDSKKMNDKPAKKEHKVHKPAKKKRKGYFAKTIDELKLVEWPSFKYVMGWSTTIIIFTALVGSVLGFTDYYFESSIKFIDCTSPTGSKNRTINECLAELTTDLSFQKYFNRQNFTPTPTESVEATEGAAPTTQIDTSNFSQPEIVPADQAAPDAQSSQSDQQEGAGESEINDPANAAE